MLMKTMTNVMVMIMITAFVNLSQTQASSEVRSSNVFIFGGTNSITYMDPSATECDRNGSISATKKDQKYAKDLIKLVFQLMHNNVTRFFQVNNNGSHEYSQRPVVNSITPNRNLIEESTEDDQENLNLESVPNIPEPVEDDESSEEYNPETRVCGESTIPINSTTYGNSIQPEQWPWWAPVYEMTSGSKKSLQYHCGGTLITVNMVLTAANCFYSDHLWDLPSGIENFRVCLGLSDRNNFNKETSIAEIKKIIIHPDYDNKNKSKFDSDIAIIVLTVGYYTNQILPACVWVNSEHGNDSEKKTGFVTSFVRENKSSLAIFKAEIVSTRSCKRATNGYQSIQITRKNFCASYVDGQDPCYGNTGQGLMTEINGKLYLRGIVVGILASGYVACDLNGYGVYTDVFKFSEWIKENIKLWSYKLPFTQ